MYVRRVLAIIWCSALLASCSIGESSKEKRLSKDKAELQQKIDELQVQIDALGPDGAGLKEIQTKLQDTSRELEESRLLQETLTQEKQNLEQDIADLTTDNQGAKILELRRLLRQKDEQLKDEKFKAEKLVAEQQYYDSLIKTTLEPFWGLYINRGDLLSVGLSRCRQFIYPENNGQITRALACTDGKLQWERQQMLTFDATVDNNLEGKYGFGVHAQSVDSSCSRAPSYLASSGDYSFERASRYGAAEFSVGLRTDLGSQPLLLDNAAVSFKSSDCEDLIARADAPGELSDVQAETLKLAGNFCRQLRGESKFLVGCFAEGNAFIPFY